MIDLDFLKSLIEAVDDSGLDHIEIERGGTRIRLSKSPEGTFVAGPAPMAAPVASPVAEPVPSSGAEGAADAGAGDLVEIHSPMVGTFYLSPAPDAPSYVDKGDRIGQGDTLCIIEAMKLMNELEAEISGTIVDILVENAEPVEYGQALFRVRPD